MSTLHSSTGTVVFPVWVVGQAAQGSGDRKLCTR